MSGIVVGRVTGVRAHPRAERIWLADVDAGRGADVTIVFGGAREAVRAGVLVPVALPGSRLPSGVKIRRRTYRGQVSAGMLCSEAEAALGDVTSRVAVLRDDAGKPGDPL